jgi:hypothetical protein
VFLCINFSYSFELVLDVKVFDSFELGNSSMTTGNIMAFCLSRFGVVYLH